MENMLKTGDGSGVLGFPVHHGGVQLGLSLRGHDGSDARIEQTIGFKHAQNPHDDVHTRFAPGQGCIARVQNALQGGAHKLLHSGGHVFTRDDSRTTMDDEGRSIKLKIGLVRWA